MKPSNYEILLRMFFYVQLFLTMSRIPFGGEFYIFQKINMNSFIQEMNGKMGKIIILYLSTFFLSQFLRNVCL